MAWSYNLLIKTLAFLLLATLMEACSTKKSAHHEKDIDVAQVDSIGSYYDYFEDGSLRKINFYNASNEWKGYMRLGNLGNSVMFIGTPFTLELRDKKLYVGDTLGVIILVMMHESLSCTLMFGDTELPVGDSKIGWSTYYEKVLDSAGEFSEKITYNLKNKDENLLDYDFVFKYRVFEKE
jgi:hypothetical protein